MNDPVLFYTPWATVFTPKPSSGERSDVDLFYEVGDAAFDSIIDSMRPVSIAVAEFGKTILPTPGDLVLGAYVQTSDGVVT